MTIEPLTDREDEPPDCDEPGCGRPGDMLLYRRDTIEIYCRRHVGAVIEMGARAAGRE
jgi:hypothetical protein